jgi:hypothetical protein
MFYRPDFCCGCGEKIERTDWKPWTSSRFCDVCATDHPVVEIAPKVAAVAAVLIGCLGVGSLFKPVQPPPVAVVRQNLVSRTDTANRVPANLGATVGLVNQPQNGSPAAATNRTKNAPTDVETPGQAEAVYFCGAETKKGTACTRKVKGNVRCWQHRGMPAMLTPDKLKASN